MKKTLKAICIFAMTVIAGVFIAACSKTLVDDYRKNGYDVFVTYDGNGGNFMGRKGVTLMDAFRSKSMTADSDGKVRIKLVEPTDKSRIKGSLTSVALSMPTNDHFFAGWYKTRTLMKTDIGGIETVTDENGVALEEINGKYYYPKKEGEEERTEATPGYLYSDRWDFENDVIEIVPGSKEFNMTLYAGWVPYYEFNYLVKNKDGEWESIGTTTFDYKLAGDTENGNPSYKNIWIPRYDDGAMNYNHKYDGSTDDYVFPKVKGKTFNKAYSDEAMTQEITDVFSHQGGIDLETATPINRVQNIYVTLTDGEIYRIETAAQFAKSFNVEGIFEIYEDLDFTGVEWPRNYTVQTFKGKITGMGGVKKFSNVTANFISQTSRIGGLFGEIGSEATIKDINFENLTVSFSNGGRRIRDAEFGLFAGAIEEKKVTENGTEKTLKPDISGVSVSGTMRLGELSLSDYSVNLVANGDLTGITEGEIKVVVFGVELGKKYQYYIDPESVSADGDGNLTMTFRIIKDKDEPEYAITL